ncbi:hypothetical protein [Fluviicola chungangensis]|uniref:Uncharacterized protein n=1 Tax=Fluviicola chungangensis TaxID=2597671 RepID=A0A556MPG3_9FLAO|nr:hypothetical protein [Fluviicola chungangensis]TSJ41688.1 hypothetical protein FO442_14630 [Fluviicola chungangensis]
MKQPAYRVVFGVRIATGVNSSVVSFVAMKYSDDGILRAKRYFTSKDEFIKVLSGYWPSPFNPDKTDYFKLNNIVGGVFVNDTIRAEIGYCPALDSLWKIRFSDWPYVGRNEAGWSLNRIRPSLKQEEYLANRYHIKQLDFDYIVDTNFWKLMYDVTDTTWIENYKFIQ